jgi:dihydrofolate reductase
MNYISLIDDDIFVIGGASIYELLLPYCDKMFLTHVEKTSKADVYFPKINYDEWERSLIDTNSDNDISYKHYEYRRAKQKKKE